MIETAEEKEKEKAMAKEKDEETKNATWKDSTAAPFATFRVAADDREFQY